MAEIMKPGRELDAWIAEKVMGWRRFECISLENDGDLYDPTSFPKEMKTTVLMPPSFRLEDAQPPVGASLEEACRWQIPDMPVVPNYSTSIEAAWEVITCGKWTWSIEEMDDTGAVQCYLENEDEDIWSRETAPTAPHAICLAALKAVGARE